MSNGKEIGNVFERQVCRLLSQYATGEDFTDAPVRDLPIRRVNTAVTPSGLEGVKGDTGSVVDGLYFPFSIECKRDARCELEGMFTSRKQWVGWNHWDQTNRQVTEERPIPMLLFTRPHRPVYCMLPERYRQCLRIEPREKPLLRVSPPGNGEEVLVGLVHDVLHVPLPKLNRRMISVSIASTNT